MNKSSIKLIVGLSIAAAATTALVIGVVRELNAIRNLTIDIDELPEEPADALEEAEDATEEAAAEEVAAEEATDDTVAE